MDRQMRSKTSGRFDPEDGGAVRIVVVNYADGDGSATTLAIKLKSKALATLEACLSALQYFLLCQNMK